MNMWYETIAGRGSLEVISCLYYNIKNTIPENIFYTHLAIHVQVKTGIGVFFIL